MGNGDFKAGEPCDGLTSHPGDGGGGEGLDSLHSTETGVMGHVARMQILP